MGLPPEIIAELRQEGPKGFEVWPENMAIVDLWLLIDTQWTPPIALADGRVLWIGLNYAAVRAGLDLAAATIDAVRWAGMRVMEEAATKALNGGAA